MQIDNVDIVESVIHSPERRQRRSVSNTTKSMYIPHSLATNVNPEIYHTFFHDKPFQRFEVDVSKLKRVSYQIPTAAHIQSRNFIMVEEKVSYGQPLNQEQFQRLMQSEKEKPTQEIVTYGLTSKVNEQKMQNIPKRDKVEIKVDSNKTNLCYCCAPSVTEKESEKIYLNKV